MNMQELNQLSQEELSHKLTQARQAVYAISEDVAHGKEKNFSQLKHLRADVARIFTALQAKEAK